MSKIKLVAIDLDDTLLRNDLTISARAKTAIAQASDKGVAVTFATGRMFSSALPYALELGLNLPLITYQGALVKYCDGRVLYHKPIPLSLAKTVIDFILPTGVHLNVYVDDELYMEEKKKDSKASIRYARIARVPVHYVDDLSAILHDDPSKLCVIGNDKEILQLAEDLDKTFGPALNITRSKPHFLELGHPDATKGRALKTLAESLGLDASQVMAIGDSWNDYDMIEYAGLGVAMENAAPEIKAIADYVTQNNDDDGVAEAIEKWILYT